ncbi:hypothetical protein HB364_31700 [Pseudoflavitalea sp. X16]|uniref:hypothetical protein n=1 Tax=Paraflavitalea devenefica TaxID=2716334 RepID=UPI00141F1413|nr:hypothetical protein [Paraflavitalea devenefica]NII29685.1 hypothetical protein [Paraflavitalea devenefica]
MEGYTYKTALNNWIKGKNSIIVCFLAILIFILIGFWAPDSFDILTIETDNLHDLLSDTLGTFTGVGGIFFAISAIILSILQIANRKIDITELAFRNSYFAPAFYFGLINISILTILNLFIPQGHINNSPFLLTRLIVIESYLLILFCLLIGIVFYKVFMYLNFSVITREYIEDVLFLAQAEMQEKMSKKQVQKLSNKGKEIYQEIRIAIEREDSILSQEFLSCLNTVIELNSTSNIVSDITLELRRWFKESSKMPDGRVLLQLFVFWRRIMSFLADSKQNPGRMYFSNQTAYIYREFRQEEIRFNVAQAFAIRLKEMIVTKSAVNNPNNSAELESAFSSIDFLFIEFNALLKEIMDHKDSINLDYGLNQLKQLHTFNLFQQYPQFESEIDEKELQQESTISRDSLISMKQRFYSKLNLIPIGLLAYIIFRKYYLNTKDIIEDTTSTQLLETTEFFGNDELYETLLTYFGTELLDFDYRYWLLNLEERKDGVAYTVPTQSDMFAALFAYLLLIKHQQVQQPTDKILHNPIFRHLLDRTKEIITRIGETYECWGTQLKITDVATFNKTIADTLEQITDFSKTRERATERAQASKPLLEEKVESFRQSMGAQWRKEDNLQKLFSHYTSIKVNPTKELVRVGVFANAQNFKPYFLQDHQIHHANLDYGKMVLRNKEQLLGKRLLEARGIFSQDVTSTVDGLSHALTKLRGKRYNPSVIISTSKSFYLYEIELLKSGKYARTSTSTPNQWPFLFLGLFEDSIPIVRLRAPEFPDKLIILDLEKAISLEQRQKDEWIDKRLHVSVSAIDEHKAEELLNKSKNLESNLSKQEAIIKLMNGVLIDIEEICDFSVIDEKAIEIITLPTLTAGK